MDLNRHNYHSHEANNEYMSRSLYGKFVDCEAGAVAYLKGWHEDKSKAFLVGSYVHAWSEGTLDEFKASNPECYTKSNELRAEFRHADDMIRALESDPFAMFALEGQKEVVMTAELFGTKWKAMFDVYVPGKRITDLKTTKSIRELSWSPKHSRRVSFIEAYEYFTQVALYSEIERLNTGGDLLEFLMVAVSKESIPDKEVINLTDHDRVAEELAKIEGNMPRILAVKSGKVEPIRCGKCDYCRTTKQLSKTIYYRELEVG